MLTGKRVLIVEEEFLIALEIQRIMEESGVAHATVARSAEEAARLADRIHNYDLAVMEMAPGDGEALQLFHRLNGAGIAVVISSADGSYRNEVPGVDKAVTIIKPFSDADLVETCRRALQLR